MIVDSLAGLVVRGVEVVAKLALYALTARLMGARESGYLFLALTWGHLAATLGRCGIERALTRLIAAELSLSQGRTARHTLVMGTGITLAAGTVLGGLSALAAPFAARELFHDPAAAPALVVAALTIPGLAAAFTLTFALTGLGRPVIAQALQNVVWPVGLLIGLAMGERDAARLVMVQAVSLAAIVFLAAVQMWRDRGRLRVNLPLPPGSSPLPSLWRTAGPLYVVELVQVSVASLPVLILGLFADAAAVSVFSVTLRASLLVLVVLLSLSSVASPRMAALHRLGDDVALAALSRRVQLAGAALGGGVCLMLAAIGQPLLSLIGERFAASAPVLTVLMAGQAVGALYAVQDSLLAMTGRGAALKLVNLAQLVTLIGLSFLLVPRWGVMGAAAATAISTAQGALTTAMAVRVLLHNAPPWMAPPTPASLRRLFLNFAPQP